MRKILVLHASAGAGHKRAAEALEQAFIQEGASPVVRDILDFTPLVFRKTYSAGYLRMVRVAPELWGYFYSMTDRKSRSPWQARIRTLINTVNTLAFDRFYRRMAPHTVVCTHFLPLEVVGLRNTSDEAGRVPLHGVVTDFAAHSLWSSPRVDGYYVGSHEAARQLVRRGQAASRVHVTGIPVDSRFGPAEGGSVARLRLGWMPDLPAILILCGGFGVGPLVEILQAFRLEPVPAQLIVVTGQNRDLRRRVERAARELTMPVMVHGFVDNMHELMAASELVVSKSGGLTSAEALASARPMVVVESIPGQEQRNAEYLLENGAAVRLVEPADAPSVIRETLGNKACLNAMGRAAARLGRPRAARDIARRVLAS